MIITQLIYVKKGAESIFHQFEAFAIPLIAKYNGSLLLRLRPAASEVIDASIEPPYEVHLVEFPVEQDFQSFMGDEERKKFLQLKEQSVRAAILIKGERITGK
ncbi:MAG: DUF1330 domain-containing protein [Puia sp.]